MNRNFPLTVAAVMATLGISAFAKNAEGHSILTEDQKKALTAKWGEVFVTSYLADLAEMEAEGTSAESAVESTRPQQELQAAADSNTIAEMQAQIRQLQQDNQRMAQSPANAEGEELRGEAEGVIRKPKAFKPDMSMIHNRAYVAAANGDAWTGNSTIDTDQLKTEFGRYVSNDRLSIFRQLVGTTDSLQYMSTIITDKFQVRASQAAITSVLQTFTPQFTPKGKTKFTPLTIKQYPMKINVEIYPSDLIDDVIGYLYDEKLEPKDMPIVRYIVMQLVKPKLDEERELAFAKGKYKEPTSGDNGYQPNEATEVCDGYVTQLCALKKAADKDVTWLLDGTAKLGTGEELLKQIETAVDSVKPLYKNIKMTIHADPDLVLQYSRAYREKYPMTKNQDGEQVKVDFTKFTFAPLTGMQGTGAFFITPKENFKHIMSRDPRSMSLRMTTDDYRAKILGEWREGVGFWIKEAIFAYLPTALVTELAPTSLMSEEASDEEPGAGI